MKRRDFIKGGAAAWVLMQTPGAYANASARLAAGNALAKKKVVWIFLRGALDSLHTVMPMADPDFASYRKSLVEPIADELLPLNAQYSLHPKLSFMHQLYQKKQMSPVVAVASGYRQRSHFEAQDQMESGLNTTDHDNGWLARAANEVNGIGIAISRSVPIALRHKASSQTMRTQTWYPSTFPEASDDLLARLSDLYQEDESLNNNLQTLIMQKQNPAMDMKEKRRPNFLYLASRCGELLKNDPQASCAMLELGGWDTHNNQQFRLGRMLMQLDEGIKNLHTALGDTWQDTLVVINTEFGRTVALNGTKGTDHGTASSMFLSGGALPKSNINGNTVYGGSVLGDWPGLAKHQLFQERDLMPTSDVRYWAFEALKQHWSLVPAQRKRIFPDLV
jgi:uncharacterized protein (DUF1501 family)